MYTFGSNVFQMYVLTPGLMITFEKCLDILMNLNAFGQSFVNFDWILSYVLLLAVIIRSVLCTHTYMHWKIATTKIYTSK